MKAPMSPTRPKRATSSAAAASPLTKLSKVPSGIRGFDDITEGGLPQGRPTLVCGAAGCGKTLFAMEFLIRGATQFAEPGVFVSFEETVEDLTANVTSIGFDLSKLEAKKKIVVEHVLVQRSEIEETGEYDLEGLFVRLGYAIDSIGAKRIVLDTLEALFSSLDIGILRAELLRLFLWLKERGVTALITAERGDKSLTRQGLEEYISDCVVLLDHRVRDEISTRRLRIVKYRGTTHATNEFPFVIDDDGISVLPLTSLRLEHQATNERMSTGIPRLDAMFDGKGYFCGSTILLSGTAGAGKTSFAASFARTACANGQRCLYLAYEESVHQLSRNMKSIGIDLHTHLQSGALRVVACRPFQYGLEMHLVALHKYVATFKPKVVVIDPVTNLSVGGTLSETRSMLTRVIDFLKSMGVTTVLTSLTEPTAAEDSEVGISSLVDSWLCLRAVEAGGERNRILTVIKSRGMPHSNQTSEYVLSAKGVQIRDAYLGSEGVLTGSARLAQEARDSEELALRQRDTERQRALAAHKKATLDAKISALRTRYETEMAALERDIEQSQQFERKIISDRAAMATHRWAFNDTSSKKTNHEKNR